MKVINSQALEPVNKALGLAGSGVSQTELLDGTVDQVLDVAVIARRGGTIGHTSGIFRVVLRNEHTGIEELSTAWQPYLSNVPAAVVGPFPPVVPDSLDVWLLGASIERVTGVNSIDAAAIRITNVQLGYGADDGGGAISPPSVSVFTVAWWNSMTASVDPAFGLSQITLPFKKINLRIPRKGAVASPFIRFDSRSTGDIDVDCVMLIGLFPVALGQDGAF